MNTNVFILPLKSSRSRGNVNSLSITRRTGCLPYQFRVDKEGLSSNAVRRPTNIASCSARFLCTSMLVSGLDSLIGFPPVRFISMKPSVDSAHFKVMYGRLSVLNVMKCLIRCRHSSSNTPTVTSIPALRSFSIPLPATRENGSMQPITTLGIFFSIIRSAQGGVFP